MSKALTATQKTALELMRERNLGAVLTGLGWVWPQGIRKSDDAALAVIEALCA